MNQYTYPLQFEQLVVVQVQPTSLLCVDKSHSNILPQLPDRIG